MGIHSDRAAQLGAAIREAGRKAEAERCRDRNGASRAAARPETPEETLARLGVPILPTDAAAASLRRLYGQGEPNPHPSSMEQAS